MDQNSQDTQASRKNGGTRNWEILVKGMRSKLKRSTVQHGDDSKQEHTVCLKIAEYIF